MSWDIQQTTRISNYQQTKGNLFQRIHIDALLLFLLLLLSSVGIVILISAGHEDLGLINRQAIRLAIAFIAMLFIAQVPPHILKMLSPWLFILGVLLLIGVLFFGDVGKGAQRWLNLGFVRFQPSELLKLATPMMIAWYLSERQLPPSFKHILFATLFIAIPTFLIAKQPDLGLSLIHISEPTRPY